MNNEKKDVLERVKQMVADSQASQDVVERYFPELRESEDERIRKYVINVVNQWWNRLGDPSPDFPTQESMLAWLEKQGEQNLNMAKSPQLGEQKPADKVEQKFKIGDWIACKELNTARIVSINEDRYEVEFIDGTKGFPYINYIDRLFHLWTIEDAENGDVLTSPYHRLIWIYKDNEHYHACVNMYYVDNVHISGEISIPNDTCPATNDERTILFSNMKKSGYKFDKKEIKKIEQKTLQWSEEDEAGLGNALCAIEQAINVAKDENDMGKLWSLWSAERWLRTLKERLQRRGEEPSIVKWARK